MRQHQHYQQQQNHNWTRIQMLLALYREAEASLQAGIDAIRLGRSGELTLTQLKSLKLILALIDGVRSDQDELTKNVYNLLLFVLQQVSREDLHGLQNGLRVLVTLRSSFEQVEDEANQLEANGEIPSLTYDLDGTLAVG